MTNDEYNERMYKIESDFYQAKKKLYYDYGMSQVIFKTGDIIRDSSRCLLIDKITVIKLTGMPKPVYHGIELKKDLTPRKDGSRIAIYGNDMCIKIQ